MSVVRRRRWLSVVAPIVLVSAAGRAAPPTKTECIDANEQTQRHRLASRLNAARRTAIACSQSACPTPIVAECVRWLGEIDALLPKVVFLARDQTGRRLDNVKVYVDGKLAVRRLDGRSTAVDPGAHAFRFVHASGSEVTVRGTVEEGARGKTVRARIVLVEHDDERAQQRERSLHPAVVPLTVLGAVGAASFTFFALRGRAIEQDLRDECAPNCSDDRSRKVLHYYIVADASLGISLLSLGAAAWFAFGDSGAKTGRVPPLLRGAF